jgi:beta-1,2-mannobiose phosphorylase / 1,2-beta-oligomannan phosphorylase
MGRSLPVLLKRQFERLLLSPSDLEPLRDDFQVVGVFNPGAIKLDGEVILMVRVAERPRERRAGYTALPRWSPQSGLEIDWVADDEIDVVDPRVVKRKADGLVRLTFISHLRVVRCGDGRSVREITDVRFLPESELEEYGVEDPRITAIEGRFYITYVSVSRHGAGTALASTTDFNSFDRHGMIFCPENKDVVLFPERTAGEYVALHRPNAATPFCRPEMWLARSRDLVHWGGHECLHGGGAEWETGRVGAGPPPVRSSEGWVEIYHGNRQPSRPGEVGMYSTGALLLDFDNPARILRRTMTSVFEPTARFERTGFVPDVVFPTGIVETSNSYLLYYGAADSCTAVVEFSHDDVLRAVV